MEVKECLVKFNFPLLTTLVFNMLLLLNRESLQVWSQNSDTLSRHSLSYKFHLQVERGDGHFKTAADGRVRPSRRWVSDLYDAPFSEGYGESTGCGIFNFYQTSNASIDAELENVN